MSELEHEYSATDFMSVRDMLEKMRIPQFNGAIKAIGGAAIGPITDVSVGKPPYYEFIKPQFGFVEIDEEMNNTTKMPSLRVIGDESVLKDAMDLLKIKKTDDPTIEAGALISKRNVLLTLAGSHLIVHSLFEGLMSDDDSPVVLDAKENATKRGFFFSELLSAENLGNPDVLLDQLMGHYEQALVSIPDIQLPLTATEMAIRTREITRSYMQNYLTSEYITSFNSYRIAVGYFRTLIAKESHRIYSDQEIRDKFPNAELSDYSTDKTHNAIRVNVIKGLVDHSIDNYKKNGSLNKYRDEDMCRGVFDHPAASIALAAGIHELKSFQRTLGRISTDFHDKLAVAV